MDPYATLKAAHAAGAWILGINHNGEYHRILDPEWSCPADLYVALVPHVSGTEILQAVARGWCHPKNTGKEMDPDLGLAISAEVNALFTRKAPQP